MSKKFKLILIPIVFITFIIVILCSGIWKKPYQKKLESIILPREAETISQNISVSDTYGKHICAEKIISSDMTCDELKTYIEENNADTADTILIMQIDIINKTLPWDDYGTDLKSIDFDKTKQYYYIAYNTPYGKLWYD